MQLMKNKNQEERLSYHPQTEQLIRNPEDIDEEIVPRI